MWEQFDSEVQTEISEWTKIKERVETELRDYDMACQKCKAQLTEDAVNSDCVSGGFHEFY